GPMTEDCTDITSPVAGYFQCDWYSINASDGWYNATANVSAPNYYNNITTNKNDTLGGWFYIKTLLLLSEANVTPRTQPWGVGLNFSLRVDDNFGDNVTVLLQYQVLGGTWEDHENRSCENCSDNAQEYTQLNWTNVTLPCTGYAGEYMKFRFMAMDNESYIVTTDVLNPGDYVDNDDTFYIDTHNVTIEYYSGS
ncbi:MAG: hypothetical protein KAT35_03755, partial [Candidatus Aenigmarchaeota archaeon]|nr:hypothetical protein [Candidatus Aenigmarchaeota archaeon]